MSATWHCAGCGEEGTVEGVGISRCPVCFPSLRESPSQDRLQQTVGTEKPTDIEVLQARVKAMRDLGVTRWQDIELGPEPAQPPSKEDATKRSQQSEAESKAREERLKFGASGGPRLRSGNTR